MSRTGGDLTGCASTRSKRSSPGPAGRWGPYSEDFVGNAREGSGSSFAKLDDPLAS